MVASCEVIRAVSERVCFGLRLLMWTSSDALLQDENSVYVFSSLDIWKHRCCSCIANLFVVHSMSANSDFVGN